MTAISWRTLRLRRALVLAIEQGIAALDALDAETEDLEDSHDQEAVDEREPDVADGPLEYASHHDQTAVVVPYRWAV